MYSLLAFTRGYAQVNQSTSGSLCNKNFRVFLSFNYNSIPGFKNHRPLFCITNIVRNGTLSFSENYNGI